MRRMQVIEGKDALLAACRRRKMKVSEEPANLLETAIQAEGNLDGMEVSLEMDCISGMPGDSQGSITFRGNLTQLLAVLARVWPTPPEVREVVSPGRKSWPDYQKQVKEPE